MQTKYILLLAGVVLIAAGILVRCFLHSSHFLGGFFVGWGFGLVLASIAAIATSKKSA